MKWTIFFFAVNATVTYCSIPLPQRNERNEQTRKPRPDVYHLSRFGHGWLLQRLLAPYQHVYI